MNCSCVRLHLISLTTIATLLFGVLSYNIAQEATSTLSGRVVDVNGKSCRPSPDSSSVR